MTTEYVDADGKTRSLSEKKSTEAAAVVKAVEGLPADERLRILPGDMQPALIVSSRNTTPLEPMN